MYQIGGRRKSFIFPPTQWLQEILPQAELLLDGICSYLCNYETDVKLLSSKPAAILYALAITSVPVLHYRQVTSALIPLAAFMLLHVWWSISFGQTEMQYNLNWTHYDIFCVYNALLSPFKIRCYLLKVWFHWEAKGGLI